MNLIRYDISTITASDFTVELDISPKAYLDFLENEYDPKGKGKSAGKDIVAKNTEENKEQYYSPAYYLKYYLKTKVESILNSYMTRRAEIVERKKNIKKAKAEEVTKKDRFYK
jgi:hypothetical protein